MWKVGAEARGLFFWFFDGALFLFSRKKAAAAYYALEGIEEQLHLLPKRHSVEGWVYEEFAAVTLHLHLINAP